MKLSSRDTPTETDAGDKRYKPFSVIYSTAYSRERLTDNLTKATPGRLLNIEETWTDWNLLIEQELQTV